VCNVYLDTFGGIEEISTDITTENSVYPNKVLNVLKVLGYLTDVGQSKK